MSELDTEARSAGNAAITALRSALADAESRLQRFNAEFAQAEQQLGKAQIEVVELMEALSRLHRGGDGHGG